MPLSPSRWHAITESSWPWEQDALDFVRERLPDQEPYHAWTNFEFIADDGSVNEVDLLILAPAGFYLVEIKSRPGVLDGDVHTWTWRHDGRETVLDNPLLLANRKAKRLASLLARTKAAAKQRLPFLHAMVFCSAAGLDVRLQGVASAGVRVRDKDATGTDSAGPEGIVATLTRPPQPRFGTGAVHVDAAVARVVARAVEQVGIKHSQKSRRVGDYELGELLLDGPHFQDYVATNVGMKSLTRRVRLYQFARGMAAETRRMLVRAAQREFRVLESVSHPSILRVVEYKDDERGPAVIFEHQPDAVRLDHFLASRGAALSVDERLGLVRLLAEAVRHAHEKRLVHRALSPQSVLVVHPDSPRRRLQVFNWQVAVRQHGTTSGGTVAPTEHLAEHIEEASALYMAPEAVATPDGAAEHLDVFSLGAIAYHVFTGQPPALSPDELATKLKADRGLQVVAVLDGASQELQELIAQATHPDVAVRTASAEDFLAGLDLVEDALTRPEPAATPVSPLDARPGDVLAGDLVVKRCLGHGSFSVVYLVTQNDRELVLKLSASAEHNERLRKEGETLAKLDHPHVVSLHEMREIDGHVGLLMDRAGPRTLAHRLREDGPLHLELLQRFGEDLLGAVAYLEKVGIPHRDIKPDNIGVAEVGRVNRLHLVLFDFSLARTPLDAIRAGTVHYLDPFLSMRKPPRWDVAAERFAAAVTLYQMATGELPLWGDGRSDPAMLDEEVTLHPERFDVDLSAAMEAFFRRALRRDATARFDNADEMLAEWRAIFTGTRHPHAEPRDVVEVDFTVWVAHASPGTPVGQIGLSTRAINALERQHVRTAADLMRLPSRRLYAMPGVGSKTRREIRDAKAALSRRLGAANLDATPGTTTGDGAGERASIDVLAARCFPRGRRTDEGELRVLGTFLAPPDDARGVDLWPIQTEVAARLKVTRARVSQVVVKARARLAKDPAFTGARNDIAELLKAHGGVMTVAELAEALLARRGSEAPADIRVTRAVSVVRAAVEAERARTDPRFTDYRRGAVVLIALNEGAADYAGQLAEQADRLAEQDPLLPPARVVAELEAVDPPDQAEGLTPARIVRLAAAASATAAASSRLELYPRGMAAARALRLAQGAVIGARVLSVHDLRERVAARYPEAERLPDRPELDNLIADADLPYAWDAAADEGRGAFVPAATAFGGMTSSTSFRTRPAASDAGGDGPGDTDRFEQRLQHSLRQGTMLLLAVAERYVMSAERRLRARFDVEGVDLEAMLIREMKRVAAEQGADWTVVRRTDAAGPSGPDWYRLQALVKRAVEAVEAQLVDAGKPLLIRNPGLLARYERLDLVERLEARTGRPGGPPAVWLLFPADQQTMAPRIDEVVVPVVSTSAWARVPDGWVQETA